jgi:hypothetical protein
MLKKVIAFLMKIESNQINGMANGGQHLIGRIQLHSKIDAGILPP